MKAIPRLLALTALLVTAQPTPAAAPSTVNYQGRFTNTAGVPQPGVKAMSLRIYDAATDGILLYSETVGNVIIDANGVYGFQFGSSGAGIPASLANALAASAEQWLELAVDGAAQAPRQKVLAVPFALMASALPDGAVSSSMIADGAVGLSKITGLGTAATADASIIGGQNKVLKTDGNGNLVLGPFRTEAESTTGTSALNGLNGNILIGDDKYYGWAASDNPTGGVYGGNPSAGKLYAEIRYDRSHSGGGEWNFDASARVCWYWNGGFQMGNANGGTHYIYMHSGYAGATATMKQSVPVVFNTSTWTGGATVFNQMAIQCAPLDLTGVNSEMAIYRNANPGATQSLEGRGTKIASIASEGVWSNGTAPAFTALIDRATITQTCSKFKTTQAARVTLGGDRTLAISGALDGMRGVIYVAQDATGGRALTLPTGSATQSAWALSSTAGSIDRLAWEYDGTYFYWTIAAGITIVHDTDTSGFISRALITDTTQKTALNNLVIGLKSNNLWTKFDAIYPFRGGDGIAHSKNLLADQYNIIWSGSPIHDAKGITGNGTDAWGDTQINWTVVGGRQNNCSLYVYCKTQTPTTDRQFMGGVDGVGMRASIGKTSSQYVTGSGINANAVHTLVWDQGPDFRRHFVYNRSGPATQEFYMNSVMGTNNLASTGVCNVTLGLLARRTAAGADNLSDVNLGFAAYGTSLTAAEWGAFRAIIDTFQAALGRANP
jgi:hypothetical protein